MSGVLRRLYHSAFRAHLRIRFWLDDHFGSNDQTEGAPLPPALLRYRVSESLSAADFFHVGKACAWHIEQELQESGVSFTSVNRALDFGCGCGSTLRWL